MGYWKKLTSTLEKAQGFQEQGYVTTWDEEKVYWIGILPDKCLLQTSTNPNIVFSKDEIETWDTEAWEEFLERFEVFRLQKIRLWG